MTETTTSTDTRPANPHCHACGGSGEDAAFGGRCGECWIDQDREALIAARYQGIRTLPSDRAYTPGERLDGRTFGPAPRPASAKQLAFLSDLGATAEQIEGLTSKGASSLIDRLLERNRSQRQPQQATHAVDLDSGEIVPIRPAAEQPARRNRYAASCADCGIRIPEGEGALTREGGRWITRHIGGCPQPAAEEREAERGIHRDLDGRGDESDLDLSELPAGRYGVPGGDTRLKVRIDRPDSGRWEGWIFVKDAAEYGEGRRYGKQRPGSSYRGDITEALAAILADPAAAAARYGELTGRCGICSRKLEDEESVARGIGPVCARKHGWL